MSGWCNGSAGYVYLWTLAHRLFKDQFYYSLAEKTAWNVWETPGTVGSLCCGLSGQAYSLLHFYNLSHEQKWLDRAKDLTNQAIIAIRNPSFAANEPFLDQSLYRGEIGMALLSSELSFPTKARMPFVE